MNICLSILSQPWGGVEPTATTVREKMDLHLSTNTALQAIKLDSIVACLSCQPHASCSKSVLL